MRKRGSIRQHKIPQSRFQANKATTSLDFRHPRSNDLKSDDISYAFRGASKQRLWAFKLFVGFILAELLPRQIRCEDSKSFVERYAVFSGVPLLRMDLKAILGR